MCALTQLLMPKFADNYALDLIVTKLHALDSCVSTAQATCQDANGGLVVVLMHICRLLQVM